MIITGLRVKNFRQYLGGHQLTVGSDRHRNVTIITGPNGAGKTNLFLALNWCLYGKGLEGKGSILSHGSREDSGFVEVHFQHDGFRYIARRDVSRRPGDHIETSGDLRLARLGGDGRSRDVPNPTEQMNEILPEDARQYFFFDSERIDEMSRPGHEEQIREAMRSVLKLKVLERAVEHLSEVEKEFARKVRKVDALSDDAKDLVDEIEDLRARLDQNRGERDAKRGELEAFSRQLSDVANRLRSTAEVKGVLLEEALKDSELRAAEARRDQLFENIAEDVARSGAYFARDALTLAQQILEEKRQRGEIPSGIREQFIDDLLKQGECICGAKLDADSRRNLLKRKQRASGSAVEDQILMAVGNVRALTTTAELVPKRLDEAMSELASLVDEMEDLQRAKETIRGRITREYGDVAIDGEEDVAGLESARGQLEGNIRDLEFELGRLEQGSAQIEKELEAKAEVLERMQTQSSSAWREKRRYELARAATDAAERLLATFSEKMRERIEAATDEIFGQLIWKEHQFERVRILDDYRLDVIDRHGVSAIRELSAGERQFLSLSFIVAMSRVTGEEAPLVIDTPFGRISEEPLHNVAGKLPKLAGQLVLLVTDKELDEAARKSLAGWVSKDFVLDFDDSTGTTSIVQGDSRA
jgi:DNA sulfur modification protein DndD